MVSTYNKYKKKHEQSNITLATVLCIPCVFAFQTSTFLEINLQQSVKSDEDVSPCGKVKDAESWCRFSKHHAEEKWLVILITNAGITNIPALQVRENNCLSLWWTNPLKLKASSSSESAFSEVRKPRRGGHISLPTSPQTRRNLWGEQ